MDYHSMDMKNILKHTRPIKVNSTRIAAMKWWNAMKGNERERVCSFYYPKRQYASLTGLEIQKMHEENLKKL